MFLNLLPGGWVALEPKTGLRILDYSKASSEAGSRNERSSPRPIASDKAKEYRPSILICLYPNGESRARSSGFSSVPAIWSLETAASIEEVFHSTMTFTTKPSAPNWSSWPSRYFWQISSHRHLDWKDPIVPRWLESTVMRLHPSL